MKLSTEALDKNGKIVAPCAGAWIEIWRTRRTAPVKPVAPCAGAWIEIGLFGIYAGTLMRRPLRGGVD